MGSVVQALETFLGPGTSDLSMRIGIHSGPIMAGVLRGEKTRFQLFGDTMNTAARIEASGHKNKIHLSSETARFLINAGKEEWVNARDTLVTAKGKGQLQTYWLTTNQKSSSSATSTSQGATSKSIYGAETSSIPEVIPSMSMMPCRISMPTSGEGGDVPPTCPTRAPLAPKSSLNRNQMKRLVDYNTQVLERYLKKMVAMRQEKVTYIPPAAAGEDDVSNLVPTGILAAGSVFHEVQESISLPTEPAKYLQDPLRVVLSPLVRSQMREFVASIASMYRDLPFHCFDHARYASMWKTFRLTSNTTRVVSFYLFSFQQSCPDVCGQTLGPSGYS